MFDLPEDRLDDRLPTRVYCPALHGSAASGPSVRDVSGSPAVAPAIAGPLPSCDAVGDSRLSAGDWRLIAACFEGRVLIALRGAYLRRRPRRLGWPRTPDFQTGARAAAGHSQSRSVTLRRTNPRTRRGDGALE